MDRAAPRRGYTFLEVLLSAVIVSVVAGGTMMAFVTAARISRASNPAGYAEASYYAQQTIEQFRNRVADQSSDPWLSTNAGKGWQADLLPAPPGKNDPILDASPKRCYQVNTACGGACYQVDVQVCWTGASPPVLGACPC